VPENDSRVRHAERTRGSDVFEVACPQELRPDYADQCHPGEKQQDAEQQPEAGHKDAGDDQQQIEFRDGGPDLDEALEQEVHPAAEIALHSTRGNADRGRDCGEDQAEQHRNPEAVDKPGHYVAALVVRSQPVEIAEMAIGILGAQREARAALLGRHQPGGRRQRRTGQSVVDCSVGEADRRPEHPAVGVDLVGDERIAIGGNRKEAAELGFGVVDNSGKQQLTLVGGEQRPIIGDAFGEQSDDEQHEEDPQRAIAAAIALEGGQPPLVDGRKQCAGATRVGRLAGEKARMSTCCEGEGEAHTARLSKSIRGSIHM
jgi:hypothetical protein